MLRTRPWKYRDQPFVCALCRRKTPVNTTIQSERGLSTCTASLKALRLQNPPPANCQLNSPQPVRWLSSTSRLRNANNNPGPPSTGSFPGAFSGAVGGTWGSFANAADSPSISSLADGLLPHERIARKQSNTVTEGQGNSKTSSTQQATTRSPIRNNNPQAKKSRSVLADVFKTNREPQHPATPTSWPSGKQRTSSSGTIVNPVKVSDGQANANAEHTAKESLKSSPSNNLKTTGWGSFSQRKSEISSHGVDTRGNESTVWSEITKSRRHAPQTGRPGVKSHSSHGHAQELPFTNPSQDGDVAKQDFWGELETRAVGFRDRSKNKPDPSQMTAADRRKAQKEASQDGLVDLVLSTRVADSEAQSVKPRRKSRLEIDEEEQGLQDRRSKKSKKSQRNHQLSDEEDWDDEAVHRWEQKQRRKAEKEALKNKAAEVEQQAIPIFVPEYISVSNLAKALKQRADSFLRDMEEMGFENITNDTIFTGETAALVAMEYGFEPTVDSGSLRDLRPRPIPEDVSTLPSRPPVVTIMGHVDHGKTTLLDWLRKSSVAAQEHGGITQHIGAFVVKMSSGKAITFLDTPGHAAFLSMRQRGANVTDIVVLVVAADDSVMPQTLEALKHATSAKVPIIVAITKVDKEDARVDQVKADLSRHGVEIEDYGGDVQVVCVSGKTGLGMDDLEENIVTLSEILDVRAEEDGMAEGWILESSIKPQGKAATILVKRGILRPGDFIVAGKTWARIRVLRNEAGIELEEALPGTPVEILGWRELPSAGELVLQSPDEGKAKTAIDYRLEMSEREESSIQLAEQEQRQREKAATEAAAAAAAADAESGSNAVQESPDSGIVTQNFTVRADVVGSVEAVCGTILELGNHEVQPKILRSSAGQITEYDVDHAAASNSVIVNFNCPIQPHIKQRAEEAKVKILDHNVIYHVVDDVKATLSDMLPMNISFRVSGEADVLQVFPINIKRRVFKNIAGCRVRNGSIKKSSRVKILRRGEVVFEGKIDTLKHVKKDVQEMGKGTECGIGFEGFDDFQPDDQIQTFEEIKEKRYL